MSQRAGGFSGIFKIVKYVVLLHIYSCVKGFSAHFLKKCVSSLTVESLTVFASDVKRCLLLAVNNVDFRCAAMKSWKFSVFILSLFIAGPTSLAIVVCWTFKN